MICSHLTREGYKNIMIATDYGHDVYTEISCPSDIVAKFEPLESSNCRDCKTCWEGILDKVKFKGDIE